MAVIPKDLIPRPNPTDSMLDVLRIAQSWRVAFTEEALLRRLEQRGFDHAAARVREDLNYLSTTENLLDRCGNVYFLNIRGVLYLQDHPRPESRCAELLELT